MSGTGRPRDVTDDEILDVFRQSDDPVLMTSEVAEEIELKTRGTFDRLEKLHEDGVLRKKKVGETGAVWWSPEILREKY